MALLLIQCPRTGRCISTGIETDPDSFDLPADGPKTVQCPFWRKEHVWTKRNALLVDPNRTYRRSMTVSSRQWKIPSEQRRRNAPWIEISICEWNENGWGLPKGCVGSPTSNDVTGDVVPWAPAQDTAQAGAERRRPLRRAVPRSARARHHVIRIAGTSRSGAFARSPAARTAEVRFKAETSHYPWDAAVPRMPNSEVAGSFDSLI